MSGTIQRPRENRSRQLHCARRNRWVGGWVANLFAFTASSRVMGWDTCKLFYTFICIIPRASDHQCKLSPLNLNYTEFFETSSNKAKVNSLVFKYFSAVSGLIVGMVEFLAFWQNGFKLLFTLIWRNELYTLCCVFARK